MKKYIICGKNGLEAEILPEKGATVTALRKDGVNFLYQDEENLASSERPRCGIPFLFPTFGRMKNETYQWEGQNYPMKIHGFAHTSPWSVENVSEDSLTLHLSSDQETFAMYPFQFRVELTFAFEAEAFTIRQLYENLGNTVMPYAYGFHPYFSVKTLEHAKVDIQADARLDLVNGQLLPFGRGTVTLKEPKSGSEVGAAFHGIKSPVLLQIPEEHRKITMFFSENYPQLVLWHPKNAPFLCVEPVHGTANGFNTGSYQILQPGGSRTAALAIKPELIEEAL